MKSLSNSSFAVSWEVYILKYHFYFDLIERECASNNKYFLFSIYIFSDTNCHCIKKKKLKIKDNKQKITRLYLTIPKCKNSYFHILVGVQLSLLKLAFYLLLSLVYNSTTQFTFWYYCWSHICTCMVLKTHWRVHHSQKQLQGSFLKCEAISKVNQSFSI